MEPLAARLRTFVRLALPLLTVLAIGLAETAGRRWGLP
jgi:hypothetical protein